MGGRRLVALAVSLALVGFVVLCRAASVEAATTTITVTTTADSSTVNTCTTTCATLRDAAAEANSLTTSGSATVTIVLPAGTTNVSDGAITLGSTTNLDFTLTGPDSNPGDAVILASGSTLGQGTLVVAAIPGISSTFLNLTITGGSANASSSGGGAILSGYTNQATTIANCVFTNNSSAAPAGGGAVAIEGGPGAGTSLTLAGSTFTGNSTSLGPGGAVLFENNPGTTGQVTLANDTFSNNTAASPAANGGAFGGAVQVVSASLTVLRSVFQANVAKISTAGAAAQPASGGALYVGSAPSASVTTSTFLNNSTSAGGEGGAIFNNGGNASRPPTLTLSSSRLVGNTSNAGHGDAVVNETDGGTVNATDNWWGQNSGPGANEVNNNPGSPTPGAVPSTSPWLQLRLTASPSTVNVGGRSTLSADLFLLSTGGTVPGSLNGLASFTGTLSGLSVTFVNGSTTATFVATTVGTFPVSATADNQTVSTNVTVQPAPLSITVSGSQTFGSSSPAFTAAPTSGSLPPGVTLSGTPTCTTVNSGTTIGPSLAAGSYTIDAGSCSGLSLSGPNAGDYTLTLAGGTFTVNPQQLSVAVSGSQAFGSPSPSFAAAPASGPLPSGVTLSGTATCATVDSGITIGPSLAIGTYTIDAGSCGGLSLSGPNAGDYALSLIGGAFTVSVAPLSVTVSGSQTFGSPAATFTAAPASGSLPSGVTLSGTPSCTTVNSGTSIGSSLAAGSYTIDASSCRGLSLSGPNAGDYTLSLAGGTFTVSPQPVPVTVTGSQLFGSAPTFTAAPTSGSLPAGVTLGGIATCTTVNSGTPIGPSLALGSYTIDGSSCSGVSLSGASAGDYSVSLVGGTFTVSVAPLPVTVSGSQVFGSFSPVFSAAPTSGSLPSGVTLTGTATCTTVNAGTPIGPALAAGSYTIDAGSCSGLSLSGPNAGDYSLTLAGGTFTVSPQSLSVTVGGSQTFGSSSPAFTAGATSGSLPAGVTLTGAITCATVESGTPIGPSLAAGSYTIDAASCGGISLSGANAGDYALTLAGGTFTVSPAPLSVTVTGSQTFGSSSPSFTAAPTSGSLPSGVTLSGTVTCTTVNSGTPIDASLAAGSYVIDAASCSGLNLSGANAGDYALSPVGGTFKVNPQSLPVTVTGSQTFGSSSPAFTAVPTSGSLPAGVTLRGTVTCATVDSGTPVDPSLPTGPHTVDAASCSGISLSGANAGDYALTVAGGTFTVTPQPLSVTVTGSQTFGSSSPTFTAVPTSGLLPPGVTLTGTATCTTVDSGTPIDPSLPAGSFTIDASSCNGLSLSGPSAADYALTLAGGTFTVSPATLPVTVSGSQAFGSSPAFTAAPTSGSLPAGVTLSGTVTCTTVNSGTPIDASLPVGSYTIDAGSCSGLSLAGPNAGDYAPSLAGGTFTVSVAPLSVTVTGNATFGSPSATFTAAPTSRSLPSGVTLSGTVTCTTVNSGTPIDSTLPAGSYTIDAASCGGLSLSGANAGDYALTLVGGTFTDSPATLQVSVSGTQTFGSSTPAFTAAPASGSLPSGVTLSGTVSCSRVTSGATVNATLAAGVYVIDTASCSGLTLAGVNAGDYALTLTGGPFAVTQSGSAIAVTVSPQNPTAGQTVTFAVTVSGDPPSGTVTFQLGGSTLGQAQLNTSGKATFSTSSLPVGTDTVTITYSGDRSFAPSSTSVTVQVAASPSSSSSSSTTGAGVTPGLPATGIMGAIAARSASGTQGALTLLGGVLLLLVGAALLVVSTRRRRRVRKPGSR